MAEPELARFLFRLTLQDFFEAVQKRLGDGHRLCGLLADEFQLVVTRDLADQLCTVRSKKCFVLSATQTLHSVSERVGIGLTRVLINNFNTTVFLRSREAETSIHAFLSLGTRQERRPRQRPDKGGWLGLISPADLEPATVEVPICPIGALGQLSPHEAYVAFADGRRTESPVWFIPWFEQAARQATTAPQAPPEVQRRACAGANARGRLLPAMASGGGHARLRVEPATTAQDHAARVRVLFSQRSWCPRGWTNCPIAGWPPCPGSCGSLREPHGMRLPVPIDRVGVEDGVAVTAVRRGTAEQR